MARQATPLDNAVIESFPASLKRETFYHHHIRSFFEYLSIVKEWLEWYNTKRIRLNTRWTLFYSCLPVGCTSERPFFHALVGV